MYGKRRVMFIEEIKVDLHPITFNALVSEEYTEISRSLLYNIKLKKAGLQLLKPHSLTIRKENFFA